MAQTDSPHPGMSTGVTLMLAFTAGASVANLYLAQPMIGLIGPAIGLDPGAYGLVVTLTQIGYATGLLLLVPLGDFLENRRLMTTTLLCCAAVLAFTAVAGSAPLFLIACLLIGVSAVTTQMVVPMAAHLAAPDRIGRQVGTVVSGLLTGILLGRPVASIIASIGGWRSVFVVSAVIMLGTALCLWRVLPRRQPHARLGYLQVLRSLGTIAAQTPLLQRRGGFHIMLFFAFSVYWTAIPLELSRHFGLGQRGIAIFALAGAAGALASPIAGRMADRGWLRAGNLVCGLIVIAGVLVTAPGAAMHGLPGLVLLALGGILIDGGVQANMAFTQRALFTLAAEQRSRVNALFISANFVMAAIGSALSPLALKHGGWPLVTIVGLIPPVLAYGVFATLARRNAV